VSLGPLHEQIARIALALPEAGQVALAGGGAMLAHDLVDRPTQDVDFVHAGPLRGDTARRRAGGCPWVPTAPRCGLTGANLALSDSR
jgi:hypothetical protein